MNRARQLKKWLVSCGVGALSTVFVGGSFLISANLKPKLVDPSYDIPFLKRPVVKPREVVMVWMDDDSHRELGQPYNTSWDREMYARLVERLTAEGARAVVFDIVFSDRHPTNPEGDEHFARAMKANGRVILGADFVYTAERLPTVMRPVDLFLDAAADWGIVQLTMEQDFMVRRHLHVPPDPDAENFSSMTWQAAKLVAVPDAQNEQNRFIERWMNYYGPPPREKTPEGTIPGVSFHRALEVNGFCPAGFFSNKVVFVGAKLRTVFSGERKDELRSPYTSKLEFIPGVEVQATQFLNLLRHDWLTRFSPRTESLTILALGLLFGLGLTLFRPLQASGLALLGAAVITGVAYYLFWKQRIWFPWLVVVAAQIPIALLWSIIYNSISSYIQNRLLEQSLSLYLSPKQVQRILKEPGLRKPGGSKQVISILFSDIASFSRISEQLDPQDLVQLLNNYYEATIRCIHETEGTVVDIIGDAIFAIWNAPEEQPDHKERMVRAALLFQKNVTQFNGRSGSLALHTRVGLHTGEVVVGNVGSSEHFDYTAIGENVNLASRLEGLNKQLGTDVLMTRVAIPEKNGDSVTRDVGRFLFKGFENVTQVNELVVTDVSPEKRRLWLEAFATALAQFQKKDFTNAEAGFKRTIELRGEDGPSSFYLKQIAELRQRELASDWAGEIELREK